MGKTTEDIKISLNFSLKGSPKGVFPTNIFEIKKFILKFAKKKQTKKTKKKQTNKTKTTLLFTQKLKIYIFASKVMSGLPTVIEKALCYQETHILLEVASTDYSLSMGNFEAFLASQRVGLFFRPYLCAFYWKEGRVCMTLCVTEYCFV